MSGRRPWPRDVDHVLELARTLGLDPDTTFDGVTFNCPVCGNGHRASGVRSSVSETPVLDCNGCHEYQAIADALLAEPPKPPGAYSRTWAEFRDAQTGEVRWRAVGLLADVGGFGVIGSTPKAGKTWLAIHMAIALVAGKPILGRYAVPVPVRVHYLALEGSGTALRHRIGALARGMSVDPDSDALDGLTIAYQAPVQLSDPASAATYCAEVLASGAAVAIIDTARRATRIRESGEGVGDLARLRENLEPLLRAGVMVILLHHARKVAQGNGTWTPPLERLSGSGDWGGLCEVGLILDRKKGTDWRDCELAIDGRDITTQPRLRVYYDGAGSGKEGHVRYDDALAAACIEVSADQDGAEKPALTEAKKQMLAAAKAWKGTFNRPDLLRAIGMKITNGTGRRAWDDLESAGVFKLETGGFRCTAE
jgi:hypothetical protein